MNPCPRCGGPQIMLLTSWACKNECDLKAVQAKAQLLWDECDATWITFVGYTHDFQHLIDKGVPLHAIPKITPLSVCLLQGGDPTKLVTVQRKVKSMPGTSFTWQLLAYAQDFDGTNDVVYWVDLAVDDPYRALGGCAGRTTITFEAFHRLGPR